MSEPLKGLFHKGDKKSSKAKKTTEVKPDLSPVANVKVIGAGGGGSNAVAQMIAHNVEGVEFVAVNTDAQALYNNPAETKVNIGKATTRGLGAGGNPELGRQSAEESSEEIRSHLEGADMVFITCGLGGGTGSGSAPVIAEVAKEMGILTVAVVTKPFSFEGATRSRQAEESHKNLEEKVDTIITIPNDKILALIDKKTPISEAFRIVDDVLRQGIQGISDLVTVNGLINVDFADVKSVMSNAGTALMGIGFGSGENRAIEAARAAIDSPLLELSIDGAQGLLFNITGGTDLSMFEVDEAAKVITEAADSEANIIFGATINENYTGEIKITVIATGFKGEDKQPAQKTVGQTTKPGASGKPSPTQSMEDELETPAFMRKKLR